MVTKEMKNFNQTNFTHKLQLTKDYESIEDLLNFNTPTSSTFDQTFVFPKKASGLTVSTSNIISNDFESIQDLLNFITPTPKAEKNFNFFKKPLHSVPAITIGLYENNQKVPSPITPHLIVKSQNLPFPVYGSNVNFTEIGNTQPKVERRKKVKQACDSCRRSHLSCDDCRPCKRCVKKNGLCVDSPIDAKTKSNKKLQKVSSNSSLAAELSFSKEKRRTSISSIYSDDSINSIVDIGGEISMPFLDNINFVNNGNIENSFTNNNLMNDSLLDFSININH
ncbi:hypothetical protein HDU92_000781 [Lobulomyces angularis]|nr:hypothetical protein HDU92_000781 [Lobulomyces angularis]